MKVTLGKMKPWCLFNISFYKENPILKWSGLYACLIVVDMFAVLTQLLEGSLQILTQCITFISLNKSLISRTIMRLWHGALLHLLLQLAAGKKSKKRAPCFYCAAGWIVVAFSAASSTSSTLWSCDGYSKRGENRVTPWLVHRRAGSQRHWWRCPLAYSYLSLMQAAW